MGITDDDTPVVSVAALDANAAEAGRDPGVFLITRTGSKEPRAILAVQPGWVLEKLRIQLTESASGKSLELFTGQSLQHESAHTNVDMGFGVIDTPPQFWSE